METKVCSRCKEEKEITEFHHKNKSKGTRNSWCAPCMRQARRDYYSRNREKEQKRIAANKVVQVERNYRYVFLYLKDHPCKHCGCDDVTILQFHHLRDKEHTVSSMISACHGVESIKAEIAKCIVLCANCHMRVTNKEQFGGHPFERYGWV